MKLSAIIPIILLVVSFSSCSKLQKVTDIVVQPTARERYQRNFMDGDTLFESWNRSMKQARVNKLRVPLPFTMSGTFEPNDKDALGYELTLKRGEVLHIDVLQVVDSALVFIDLFEFENDSTLSKKPLKSNDWQSKMLQFEPETSGRYKIIIQPELASKTTYNLIIYTQPTLGFPVIGKGNAAIQSFWGAARGGGNRSHEGVDIFASRGTPVVAITNGFVSSAGERGLGGKQVWLRSGVYGMSLYYAHLDSIAVSTGTRVKIGDTLGFVGNTGNAKTTPPHLHFGIYTGRGAIDPFPFIKQTDIPLIKTDLHKNAGVTTAKQNQLRSGPMVSYEKLATLSIRDTLSILGKSEQWYQVKIKCSLEGFIHQSLIKQL